MASKKAVSSLQDCLIWIQQEQKSLRQASYSTNLTDVQDDVEKHEREKNLISEFKGFMAKLSSKYTDEEIGKMNSGYNKLMRISQTREKCLQTLLHVSEIEALYQNVSSELDSRSLALTSDLGNNDELRPHGSSQTKAFQVCVEAVEQNWKWLSQLNFCLATHEANAAAFHQFHHELSHCSQGLSNLLATLDKTTRDRKKKDTRSIQNILTEIKETTMKLLDFQETAENLFERSKNIIPMRLRRETCSHPAKGVILATFQSKEFTIKEGDECRILDNSDNEKWKIQTSNDKEHCVPSIIVLIPGPDDKAIDAANRLRVKLMGVWEFGITFLRKQIIWLLTRILDSITSDEVETLHKAQRHDILKVMKDVLKKLSIEDTGSPSAKRLLNSSHRLLKILQEAKVDTKARRGSTTSMFLRWKQIETLANNFEDFTIYADDYATLYDSSHQEQHAFICDDPSKLRYVTSAYVNRMKPVEIDEKCPITIHRNEETLWIHESKDKPDDEMNEFVNLSSTIETVEEEVFTSSTVHETQTLVITGVTDPRTKEVISIFSACAQGVIDRTDGIYRNPDNGDCMTIQEAINEGLIQVEYKDKSSWREEESGVIRTIRTKQGETFSISSAIDQRTGKRLKVDEAIREGVIDQDRGLYVNPATGETMSLADAIAQQFVQLGRPETSGMVYESRAYVILGVTDPRTGKDVTLEEAIASGIIDVEKGLYKNLNTGVLISITEAIKRGLVKARSARPDEHNLDNVIKLRVRTANDATDGSVQPRVFDPAYMKLKDKMDMTLAGIRDLEKDMNVTLEEAVQSSIMTLDVLEYATPSGEKYIIQEAVAMGFVEPTTAAKILQECEIRSLDNVLQDGSLDAQTSLVVDPSTGLKIMFRNAVDEDYLDPDKIFYYDLIDHRIASLGWADRNGKFSNSTGRFNDPTTGKPVSIADAIENQMIDPRIDTDKIMERTIHLAHVQPHVDINMTGIKHPLTGNDLSIKDAILSGVLSIPEIAYINTGGDEAVDIPEAVNAGLIKPNTAKQLYNAMDKMSLGNAMQKKLISSDDGLYQNPETRDKMSIEEAMEQGHLDPNFIFFVDNVGNEVVTLAEFIDQGQFNAETGKFIDPSGREISISIAVKRGLIEPNINPDNFIEEKFTLQSLYDDNKANPDSILNINGNEMTVKEALDQKLITMGTTVRYDPKTGQLSLAQNDGGDIVGSLIVVSDKLNWVAGIEEQLAQQQNASEDLDKLREQLETVMVVDETIKQEKEPLQEVINSAQVLLDEYKENMTKEDPNQQQYQSLRFKTSDLKVRFEGVSSTTDQRVKHLGALMQQLEEFAGNLDNFDDWIESGTEKIGVMQKSVTDLDNLQEHAEEFKNFVDEAMSQEGNVVEMTKQGARFKASAQEYGQSLNKFLESLPEPVIKVDQEEHANIVTEEIEGMNDKYKDLLTKVMSLMAMLTETVDKSKEFKEIMDELQEWFPETEEQISNISIEQISNDPTILQKELDMLCVYSDDVASQGKLVEDLKAVGGELIDFLEEAGAHDKADHINNEISSMEERFNLMNEQYEQKQKQINKILMQSQDISFGIENLLAWIGEAETRLDTIGIPSVDKEKLKQQMHDMRVLTSDLNNKKGGLESAVKRAEGVQGAEEKAAEAEQRFTGLESQVNTRAIEHENVQERLNALQRHINSVESWITKAVTALKKCSEMGPNAAKDKFDELYQQKHAKEKDIDDIRKLGKDLLMDSNVKDKNSLRETLADVQAKWNNLTEMLVQVISMEALREIEDMLTHIDKAENEIHSSEPIPVDPETLSLQLKEQRAFNEDLKQKTSAVKDIITKCNQMLRETTNEEADNIKNKLEHIRAQADMVCKLSDDRLKQFEDAMPLVSHFNETHSDLLMWLEEVETEVKSVDPTVQNIEQLKKQQELIKCTQRLIEDHQPIVEDLSSTGKEVVQLCSEDDSARIQEKVYNVNNRFDDVKAAVRDRMNELDDAFRNHSTEVIDTMAGLQDELQHLNDQVENAEPIAATPVKIKEQITDTQNVLEDLGKRKKAVTKLKDDMDSYISSLPEEDSDDGEELQTKVSELEHLHERIKSDANARSQALDDALDVGDKFWNGYQSLMDSLQDLQDNLHSQDTPQVEPTHVKEQQNELQAIKEDFQRAKTPIADCKDTAKELTRLVGEPAKVEVAKAIDDLDGNIEIIEEEIKDRHDNLENALQKGVMFEQSLQNVGTWLPKFEDKLSNMGNPAADTRGIRIQIEELKVLKLQVHPRCVDIECLNNQANELKNINPLAADSVTESVGDANDRWGKLITGIADKETQLQNSLITLGELDHALDDVIGFLAHAEQELGHLDDVYGDPKYIETHLRKLQLLQKDMNNHEPSIKVLNKKVGDIVANNPQKASPLSAKKEEMNELWKIVCIGSQDKQNYLQDILKQAKAFMGEVDDLIQWLGDYRLGLKSVSPLGALPDTSQKQYEKFMNDYYKLHEKEDAMKILLLNGEDMMARCKRADVIGLRESLGKLKGKWDETTKRADRQKIKIEEHLENVNDFHTSLQVFTEWLTNAENKLAQFKYPSKICDKVDRQVREHKDFQEEISAHKDMMQNIDRTGTYLKYFGRKQDTVHIKNLLIGIRLRWKKVVRKSGERGRHLQQAYREDKRFYDSWKELCDWLEDTEQRLVNFIQGKSPTEIKQFMDDLKMSAKHPQFYTTSRLGRNLKDRCTKNDPDRETLQNMIDELKNRWNVVRSLVSQRQGKLDEALLMSGRLSDAVQSLMEWLTRAETALVEDEDVLGDIDTVNILMEQHKAFQQELDARQGAVDAIREQLDGDTSMSNQLEKFNRKWESVNHLSETRDNRLQEALSLAEEFQEVVHAMREWLPNAETELKTKEMPEDEEAILEMIVAHEKFEEEMNGKKQTIDRIKELADEILQNCHQNAIRFVKYYLTITWTRFEQALTRAKQKSQKLQDALRNIRGNAVLLEELLAWTTEAQALLTTKEQDDIPEDLTVVEQLVKQHQEFHEELSNKGKDVEQVASMPTSYRRRTSKAGGETELLQSPRLTTLQGKWRNVWRMSVERKKKLKDILEHMVELESFKNFDFDLWRKRYLKWIKTKKLRITDFFRRQDKTGDGILSKKDFVEGMLASGFPSNKTELNAVFEIFDKNNSGEIDYKEFVEALNPRLKPKRPLTDAEMVHDEIERQVSRCCCRKQFTAEKISDGKYMFGESKKMVLVRFLNTTVMVRVGGGWATLKQFLEQHDPCQAKGRTNTELREKFLLPEGASQTRAAFTPKRRVSSMSNSSAESRDTNENIKANGNHGNHLEVPAPQTLDGTKHKSSSSTSLASSGSNPNAKKRTMAVNGKSTKTMTPRMSPSTPVTRRTQTSTTRRVVTKK